MVHNQIVLTLDAGGTNFSFSAIQHGKAIVAPVKTPSNGHDLDLCLKTIISGFEEVLKTLGKKADAISFAFPGPADYPNGVIGDLNNLPAFRGGVPLAAILEDHFKLPVFINNDGDLFAYGEARGGMLPEINAQLKEKSNPRTFKNLIGLTLGTGFGAGIVINNQLLVGDNSLTAEVWTISNRVTPEFNAEEIVSTRSVISEYNKITGNNENIMPFDIYNIAKGEKPGNKEAAKQAFFYFGRGLGDAIANLVTLLDGLVVIGGGITGASDLYLPGVMHELNRVFTDRNQNENPRIVQKVYDYDNPDEKNEFLKPKFKNIEVADKNINYEYMPYTAIAHSKNGAEYSIQLGAYLYAINHM